ncbi:MAG TPA: hypothetical protein VFV79_06740 [Saprospiraceae bacterium]|nr:hypothetical protein [Saprospiraceae bacterium]
MDDKTKSIVAHITLIGWIIALVMNQSDKGPNTSFYLRQNLGLMILALAGSILGIAIYPLISTIIGVAVLILWILSLIGSLSGEQKLTPVFGDMFQSWFKGIS